jgi:hypothetical protein
MKPYIVVTEWDGIDHSYYPDYCDDYIVSAESEGVQLTDEEIEGLNDSDLKYELLMEYLY